MNKLMEIWDTLTSEQQERLEIVMAKYGTNQWWNSDDILEIAKYQIFEDVIMVEWSTFHYGIEKLLNRPVWTHEFGLNMKGLRQEAKDAIERLEKGFISLGREYVETKVQESIGMLRNFCKMDKKSEGEKFNEKGKEKA